jgi:hypothetical protein
VGNVYGSAIVDGAPRFSSASSLTTFDPNSFGGCNRKWYIEKVLKQKQEETEAMRKGTNLLHKPIENYYETGIESFPPLALAVRRYLYERGPDLLIEAEIGVPIGAPKPTEQNPMTDAQLAVAPVRAGDIPIVGRMDLVQARGYFIDENGELRAEPRANTVEINDWKSTSDEGYAKTTEQLRAAVQMITYGEAAIKDDPNIENVRLSHTYSLTRGAARGFKRTALVPAEEIVRRWEYVDGLGRQMRDVAAEANIEKVPGNKKSCNAYGRNGCPFKHPQANGGPPLCSIGRFNSLTSLFGEAGSKYLLEQQQEIIPTMSILNRVNNQAAPTGATGIALPTVTPANPPAAVGVALTLGAQPTPGTAGPNTPSVSLLDALEAEEAAQTAPQIPTDVAIALSVIATSEMGYPKMTGEALAIANAYGAKCTPPRAYSADGTGRLSGLNTFATGAELLKLAEDLKAHAAKKAAAAPPQTTAPQGPPPGVPALPKPAPTSILSPEAPPSNPALAALPVEGLTPPPQVPRTAIVGATGMSTPGVMATPAQVATIAQQVAAQPTNQVAADPAPAEQTKADKPKAPRKAKAKGAGTAVVQDGSTLDGKPAGTVLNVSDSEDEFELYVNCIPSKPYESLDNYIAQWCKTLVGFFYKPDQDLPDIRCIVSDNRMNFNKWPGPLAALIREVMIEGKMPRAAYVIDTRNNTIAAEVANAMISARTDDGAPVLDFYAKGI